MYTKWNREYQALWTIFKSVIKAFKISKWLTIQQEEEFVNLMQKYIEKKDKNV